MYRTFFPSWLPRSPCRTLALEGLEQRLVLSALGGEEVPLSTEVSPIVPQADCCEPLALAPLAVAAPVAEDDWASILPGSVACVAVLDNDLDPDGWLVPSTVQVVAGPESGVVEIDEQTGVICYAPGDEFDGVDSFLYVVEDNDGNVSNEALVTIVCWQNPENRLDVNGDHCLAPSDMLCLVNRLNAMPGDCSLPPEGCTPPLFYDVSGDGVVSPLDMLIVVHALNRPAPVATADWAVTLPGEPVEIPLLANDCDPDGELNAASILIVSPPSAGSVSVDEVTGVALYTPGAEFAGVDHFSYTVQDCDGRATGSTLVTIVSWQNPVDPYNVDNVDAVTAADALCLINWLTAHPGDSSLPPVPLVPPPFYDVNGDMFITAADLLCVFNALQMESASWDASELDAALRSLAIDELMAELGFDELEWQAFA